jgi:predicted transcriptional regulator
VQQIAFITNHGRVLLYIAAEPDARLRDIGAKLGITERRVYDIVTDLVVGGYVIKTKVGRRNRYEVQDLVDMPESIEQARAIGDLVQVMTGQRGKLPA